MREQWLVWETWALYISATAHSCVESHQSAHDLWVGRLLQAQAYIELRLLVRLSRVYPTLPYPSVGWPVAVKECPYETLPGHSPCHILWPGYL